MPPDSEPAPSLSAHFPFSPLETNPASPQSPRKRLRVQGTHYTPQDRLGKQVYRDEVSLLQFSSLADFLRARRGRSNLTDLQHLSHHPAKTILQHLTHTGFPAGVTTPPWTLPERDAAMTRGPHKSAHEHVAFLREELADMVDRATWVVLPYHLLRHIPNLRISPMGVVPQNDRRPRPIVDYSFSGVNQDTRLLAPREAMQFGRALERLIWQVVHSNPAFGPVQFMKIDVADGFYRVWLDVQDVPTLAVSVPHLPGEPRLLALPLALPMGWTQSPPAFCMVTETIADLANRRLHNHHVPPPYHRLEPLARSPATDAVHLPPPLRPSSVPLPPPNPRLSYLQRPLATVDVFVDDFLGAAQGSESSLSHTRRTLMHAIDTVLRPLDASDIPSRTEPISTTKLLKGDANWATCKKMLGWIIDSHSMTLTLPPRRLQRLADILDSIPSTQRRLSLDTWSCLLGELRSMSLALPGARGLFSHLQQAGRSRQGSRLRLTPAFHRALDDFRWLLRHLGSRPTRLFELVPTAPTLLGSHDASGSGAGGVWLPHPTAVPRRTPLFCLSPPVRGLTSTASARLRRVIPSHPVPVVWRTTFPPAVASRLVSADNLGGDLNNSVLELVGAYLHDDVAAHCFDVRERTLKSGTDNIATLYWYRRGSVTTTSPTATLLRNHAMHQRFHRYVSLKDYIPGPVNTLADDASRFTHLSDAAFLSYFNSTYPQAHPWHLYHPRRPMLSSATCALRNKMSPMESFLHDPPPPLHSGLSGTPSAPPSMSLLPFKASPTPSHTFRSLPCDTATAASAPVDALSVAAPWKVPYVALAKRLPVWGPRTPDLLHKAMLTSV